MRSVVVCKFCNSVDGFVSVVVFCVDGRVNCGMEIIFVYVYYMLKLCY